MHLVHERAGLLRGDGHHVEPALEISRVEQSEATAGPPEDHVAGARDHIGEAVGDVIYWLTELPGRMYDAGRAMVDGLVNGIRSGLGALKDAITGMGQSTVQWLRDTLGIRSPSRVFAQLGGYVGEGFAQGIGGSAGMVGSAAGDMSDAALAGVRAAGSRSASGGRSIGGSGAGISITIAPTITSAATDPAAVAAEVLPRLGALVQDEVEQALERMALA